MRKSQSGLTLLFYGFTTAAGYSSAGYVSALLSDNDISFEINVSNFIRHKILYPRRIFVERKKDPVDYLKTAEEQEETLNKIIYKKINLEHDKTWDIYEFYNVRKNFFYGLVFGTSGLIYKRQVTLYLQNNN